MYRLEKKQKFPVEQKNILNLCIVSYTDVDTMKREGRLIWFFMGTELIMEFCWVISDSSSSQGSFCGNSPEELGSYTAYGVGGTLWIDQWKRSSKFSCRCSLPGPQDAIVTTEGLYIEIPDPKKWFINLVVTGILCVGGSSNLWRLEDC